MRTRTALRGVEAEAGHGFGTVGDFRSAGWIDGGVLLAGGDDLESACGQERPQADIESEGKGFFVEVADATAGVVAAVGRVKDYDETGGGGRGSLGGELAGGRKEQKRCEKSAGL